MYRCFVIEKLKNLLQNSVFYLKFAPYITFERQINELINNTNNFNRANYGNISRENQTRVGSI